MRTHIHLKSLVFSVLLFNFVASAQTVEIQTKPEHVVDKTVGDVVYALNVGGPAYLSSDGVSFQGDLEFGGKKLANVNAAQDVTPYQTFRSGKIELSQTVQNGSYGVTLYFVEPNEDVASGGRVFNILIEDEVEEANFDVRAARDGNAFSALTHSIPEVVVLDGSLDIQLQQVEGEPVLSAVIVRQAKKIDSRWGLIWSDEFNYQGKPDADKWTHEIWAPGKVNREDQQYTDSLKNVRVQDGRLIIEAHKLDKQEANYSSGRIHSAEKGDLLYGRIDIRAKLPAGQGTWPALWMMPTNPFTYATNCNSMEEWHGNDDCDAWPNSGEIDIMEHVGYDMNRVHGTVHTRAYYWVNGLQRKASVNAGNVAEEFHIYSLEWSPERIDVFIDNLRYFTYLNDGGDWQSWPFDHPFHMILNLAIGGDWGRAGGPIDDSIFPVRMEVDYVRFYKATNP